MDIRLTEETLRIAINDGCRIMFHGTCRGIAQFDEQSIGKGGDDNSALGVHLSPWPDQAAEYAQMSVSDGEPRVLVVLAPARSPIDEHRYDRFFGLDDQDGRDPEFGKAGFAGWRRELLALGHDMMDYEDGDGPISVCLVPDVLVVAGSMGLDEAHALRERLDEMEDPFCAQAIMDELELPVHRVARPPIGPK